MQNRHAYSLAGLTRGIRCFQYTDLPAVLRPLSIDMAFAGVTSFVRQALCLSSPGLGESFRLTSGRSTGVKGEKGCILGGFAEQSSAIAPATPFRAPQKSKILPRSPRISQKKTYGIYSIYAYIQYGYPIYMG